MKYNFKVICSTILSALFILLIFFILLSNIKTFQRTFPVEKIGKTVIWYKDGRAFEDYEIEQVKKDVDRLIFYGKINTSFSAKKTINNISIYGVSGFVQAFYNTSIINGRWFENKGEIVLTKDLANSLCGTTNCIGLELFIEENSYIVVGVISNYPTDFIDSEIFSISRNSALMQFDSDKFSISSVEYIKKSRYKEPSISAGGNSNLVIKDYNRIMESYELLFNIFRFLTGMVLIYLFLKIIWTILKNTYLSWKHLMNRMYFGEFIIDKKWSLLIKLIGVTGLSVIIAVIWLNSKFEFIAPDNFPKHMFGLKEWYVFIKESAKPKVYGISILDYQNMVNIRHIIMKTATIFGIFNLANLFLKINYYFKLKNNK